MRWRILSALACMAVVAWSPNCGDSPTAPRETRRSGSGPEARGPTPVPARYALSESGWRVEVSPKEAEAAVGDTVRFGAKVYNPGGKLWGTTARWAVEGGVGTIDARGLLEAQAAGEGIVIASAKGAADTAHVTVTDVTPEAEPEPTDTIPPAVPATPSVDVGADSIRFATATEDTTTAWYRWYGGLDAGGGAWGPDTTAAPEHAIARQPDGLYYVCTDVGDEVGNLSDPACNRYEVVSPPDSIVVDSLRTYPESFAFRFTVDEATQDTTWERARWSPLSDGEVWSDTTWVSGSTWPIYAVGYEGVVPFSWDPGDQLWHEVQVGPWRLEVCTVPDGAVRQGGDVAWAIEQAPAEDGGPDPVAFTPPTGLPPECTSDGTTSTAWLGPLERLRGGEE